VARQLALTLPARAALGRADFIVAAPNRMALALVDGWRGWPGGKLVLIGPEGAGKSHLAHVWAGEAGARLWDARTLPRADDLAAAVVEDVDRIAGDGAAEAALFHFHNRLLERGGRLLMTGRGQPSTWGIALPDLASRLAGTQLARIDAPDDDLLVAVLRKHFADRQLIAQKTLIPWLVRRMPRSFAAAAAIVSALDAEALAQGGAVSRTLATRILDKFGATDA
jgi:chromosomal replication initiation ATPase DnaA